MKRYCPTCQAKKDVQHFTRTGHKPLLPHTPNIPNAQKLRQTALGKRKGKRKGAHDAPKRPQHR